MNTKIYTQMEEARMKVNAVYRAVDALVDKTVTRHLSVGFANTVWVDLQGAIEPMRDGAFRQCCADLGRGSIPILARPKPLQLFFDFDFPVDREIVQTNRRVPGFGPEGDVLWT